MSNPTVVLFIPDSSSLKWYHIFLSAHHDAVTETYIRRGGVQLRALITLHGSV